MIVAVVPATFILGVQAVKHGWWQVLPVGMLLISPVAMAVLRYSYEDPFSLNGFLKPSVMSRAFVVGDILLLPAALGFAGRGWQVVPGDGWGYSLWFALVAFAAGISSAVVFRRFDGPRYMDAGVPTALLSPTKMWHDLVVMPVVIALFVWLLAPQLFGAWSSDAFMALTFLVGFGVLVVADALNPPDPAGQHPAWDAKYFQSAL